MRGGRLGERVLNAQAAHHLGSEQTRCSADQGDGGGQACSIQIRKEVRVATAARHWGWPQLLAQRSLLSSSN